MPLPYPHGLLALALHQSSLSDKQLRQLLLSQDNVEDVFSLDSLPPELALQPEQWQELAAMEQTIQQSFIANNLLIQQWQYCLEQNIGVISLLHPHYPMLLKQTYDPPPVLYYRGNIHLLNSPQLAMVGSRRSSLQGNKNAFLFAKAFAQAGFTISSGLALGIDRESHLGALAAGGNTIAVLGTGIDVIYPWRNRELYQNIVEDGLILSELPLGSEPKKGHFPRRNRIISGMSLGVLVVEASLHSGSLITAQCALEQGREVFAIPSSIHNPTSRGCHALIRQGAKLVETTEHVMEELGAWLPALENGEQQQCLALAPALDTAQQQLLDKLGFDPQTIDTIQQCINMPVTELMANLLQLELAGLVENVAGRYQRVV